MTCVRRLPFEQLTRCVDTSDVSEPAAVLLLCLDLRKRRHYSNAYELGLLEAGQLLQNLSLSAASRGVGACILGSVFDEPFWAALSGREVQDVQGAAKQYGRPLIAVALGHQA